MNILIISTGGTFDKVHDPVTESLVFSEAEPSQIGAVLKRGRCHHPDHDILMSIDSLDMVDMDREAILAAVKQASQSHIIITHGTGTMEDTARFLDGKIGDKTVVLTGALRPVSLGQSDGEFNLGGAVIAVQTLPSGVYVVMNGRVFTAQDVHKDTKTGRFDH